MMAQSDPIDDLNRPVIFSEKQMEWRGSLMIRGSWLKVGKCG